MTIPGFYDDVVPLTDHERTTLASLPFDDKQYLTDIGSPKLDGEESYTTLERKWAPSLLPASTQR